MKKNKIIPEFILENENWDKKSLKFFDNPQKIEWKDLVLDIVAFANNKGGNIYFGIEDKESIPALEQKISQEWQNIWFSKIKKQVQTNSENLNPLILSVERASNNAEYVKLQISPSRNSVACRSDGVYAIRFNDETHRLKPNELSHLFAEKGNIVWELAISNFLFENCDADSLKDLLTRIRQNEKVDSHIKQKTDFEICQHYRLVENNILTYLGVLWIGTKIMRSKIQNLPRLSVVFYDKNERRSKPQKDFTDLSLSPVQMLDAVDDLKLWESGIEISDGLYRTFVNYYPQEVLKELLANALCHRAYTMGGDIFINVFEDKRIEIINPGSLPLGVTPSNILHTTNARNQSFAELAKATKMMEKLGSGYDKIYEKMFSQGQNPPTVGTGDDFVKVVLEQQLPNSVTVNLISKLSKEFIFTQKELITLGLVVSKDSLTAKELVKELQLSKTEEIKHWIGNLIIQKIILSRGETSGTQYFINPQILKKLNHKGRTSLKMIEKPRLKNLILEDLRFNPNSSISEIHERIGSEINKYKVRNLIYDIRDEGQIGFSGSGKYVKYFVM
jgi:ATP-dependent DNA helicase RecG